MKKNSHGKETYLQMMGITEMIRDAVDHHRAGHLEQAEGLYRRVLRAEPENAVALHLLGSLAHQRSRNDVALDLVRRAIACDACVAEFHNTLGAILQALGRLQDSLGAYRQAVLLKPDYAEVYNNMAMVFQDLGDCSQAVENYERATQLAPDIAEIYYNLANALCSEGRLGEAADNYWRAIKLKRDYAEAYNNLGIVLREQGELEQATESYRQAIRLKPDCVHFHSNLASILQHQGRLAEAVSHCEHAIGLDPDCAELHYNFASAWRDMGRCDEAIEQNSRAIRLKPDYAEAHWNQAIAYLLNGDFPAGWNEYEWRRKTDWHESSYPHRHDKPRWDGTSFEGFRLLVHCEQGLGDCLQLVRYLPMVKKLGGTVIFEAWRSLHGLLEEKDNIDELVELSFGRKTPVEFDFHVSIMDLPGIFGTTGQTIPSSVPYIYADRSKTMHWRQKLLGPELKVGIVWAGSARHANDHNRSCGLERFEPLSQIEGVRLYGLQKGQAARQVDHLAGIAAVENLAEQFTDFTDAAAVIENLDLVISVDTAVLHLAGAMGKPVWALLPLAPDWRWMLERTDSPWYPTMRLFRQQEWGDWDSVFRNVAEELRIFTGTEKVGCK